MGARSVRKLVFQIIWLVIFTIIAVCLVKTTFFPAQDKGETYNAQGTFELPTITVEKGSIENAISLSGTVIRNEATPAKATAAGEVSRIYVEDGAQVTKGTPILQVKSQPESNEVDEEGLPIVPDPVYTKISADADGKLKLDVLKGQQVSIGDPIGTIESNGFHVQVSVTPDQLYSLSGLPDQAEVAINDGPAPFTCTNLHTQAATSSSSANSDGSSSTSASSPQLRCDIPSDQTVYDGVKAKLNIDGGRADDVLTVPVSAVSGRFGSGKVYLPAEGSQKPEEVTVELGLSDGRYIEIKSGLEEGQAILQFVPSSTEDDSANTSLNMEG